MKLFGHKYTYIVKSHPSDRDSIQYVFQKDIKSLYTISSSIPVELVMCSYSKKIRAVVGEETSSFLSVPKSIDTYSV